jgi:hypothetical protein
MISKERDMKRISMALLGCTALGFSLVLQGPFPGPAQAQPQGQASTELDPKNPTVQSLTRVRYGDAPAKFVLSRRDIGIWEEYREEVPNKWRPGKFDEEYIASYVQTGGDANSIELHDLNRDVKLTIDLSSGTVSSTGADGAAGGVRKLTEARGLSQGPAYPVAPKLDMANWVRSPVIGAKKGDSFVLPIRDGWNGFTVYAQYSVNTIMSSFNQGTPTTKADVAGPYGGIKGEFKLQPGERITGFSGTYTDDDMLKSLQISTSRRQSQLFGAATGERQFNLTIPKGHRLVALTGRAGGSGSGIYALGLITAPIVATAAPSADAGGIPFAGAEPESPVKKFEGIWVQDKFETVEALKQAPLEKNINLKGANNPNQTMNGTWIPREYYVIRTADSDKSGKTAELRLASAPLEVGTYVTTDGEHFRAQTPIANIPFFTWSPEEKGDAPRLRFGNGMFVKKPPLPNQELKKTVDVQKVSQEDAWLVEKIPLGVYFNFAGYDITEINPLVLAQHFKAPVFAPGGSTTYEFQDHKIVPHGLQYRQKSMSESFVTESAITSEKEMQESSSFSIGLNVAAKGKGDPPNDKPKAAGGINYAKSQMRGTSDGKNVMRSFGVQQIHDYVLILDQGHMKVSLGFLNMIADIKANRRPVSDLFEKFGTHYPNAVTYGAAARASMRFDSSDVRVWAQNKESVNASITIPVKAMEITSSVSSEKEKSESNRLSSSNKVETFTAVGGNAGSTSATFQADANRVVPVLFDLRPIHELINPIHFDDDEVLGRVRSQIVSEWNARFAGISLSSDDSRKPRVFEFRIQGLSCDRKGDTLEMYGSIKFTFPDERGPQVIDIMNGSSFSNPRKVVCASGSAAPGTEAAIVTVVSNGSGDVLPEISVSGLNEADLGNVLDPDDRYVLERKLQTSRDGSGNLAAGAVFKPSPSLTSGPRVDTNSGSKLILRYTWRELELP